MVLFLSEMCRLILGFLEEENLIKTYEAFLNECKYLEECKSYHQKSLQFSKKINGKTLKDFLLINESVCYLNSSTQTDLVEIESAKISNQSVVDVNTASNYILANENNIIIPNESKKDEDIEAKISVAEPHNSSNSTLRKLLFETDLTDNNLVSNKKTKSMKIDTSESNRKKSSRKNTMASRRKSNLILTTPTKNQTQNYHLYAETDNLSSANDNNNYVLEQDINHEIDAFIESLCKNNFAQKLAQSINEMNIKKLANSSSIDDGSKNISNLSLINNNTNNILIDGPAITSTQNIVNNDNIKTQEHQNLIEPNNNINVIGNSSILENNLDNLDFDLLVKPSSSQMQTMETLAQFMPNQNDPNNDLDPNFNKIMIANEEISLLAEFFAEPAVVTLFEVLNTSRDNSLDRDELKQNEEPCPNTIKTNNNENKIDIEEKKIPENEINKKTATNYNEKTLKEDLNISLNNTIDLDETMDDADDNLETTKEHSFIKYESECGDLSYSVNKTKKSFIIIAKTADLIEKTEKDIIDGKIKKKIETENEKDKLNDLKNDTINLQAPLAHSSEKELVNYKNIGKNLIEETKLEMSSNKDEKVKKNVKFNLSDSSEMDESEKPTDVKKNSNLNNVNENVLTEDKNINTNNIEKDKINTSNSESAIINNILMEANVTTLNVNNKSEQEKLFTNNNQNKGAEEPKIDEKVVNNNEEKTLLNDPISGLKCLANVATNIIMNKENTTKEDIKFDEQIEATNQSISKNSEIIEKICEKIPTPVSSPNDKIKILNPSPLRRTKTIRAILETSKNITQENDSSMKNDSMTQTDKLMMDSKIKNDETCSISSIQKRSDLKNDKLISSYSKNSHVVKESASRYDSITKSKNINEYLTSTPVNSSKNDSNNKLNSKPKNVNEYLTSTSVNSNKNNSNKKSNPKPNNHKGSKRYFSDFYENIKDFDDFDNQTNDNKKPRIDAAKAENEKNNDSDTDELPAIFNIARRRQEELKAKLKNKLTK